MPRSTRTTDSRHSGCKFSYLTVRRKVRNHLIEQTAYVYPNDEREMDRLDMQHHMCKLLTGGRLYFAPLKNPRRILDIGTGSGIWPIEISNIFPDTMITGTDLSPCQPNNVPENVHFIVDDMTENEWVVNRNTHDFIHAGHLSGSLPSYRDLLRKMYSHLKPGGWAELHEFDTKVKCDDDTMPPLDPDQIGSYQFQDWCDLQVRSGHDSDPPRQFRIAHRLARGMREVGFVDVHERIFKAPVNPWSDDPHLHEIGRWNEENILEALSGWSYKPFATLAWSKNEIEVFLATVRKSISNRRVHAYLNFHVVFGRKPCAYRHAVVPSSAPLIDHFWISEELLASTFQRFTKGQRRYESRVPGPLEARRRLAKRKNTALASVAGSGPMDDVACLFGRNGREHMKWTDSPGQGFDYQFSPSNPVPSTPSFYTENPYSIESSSPLFDWLKPHGEAEKATRDRFFNKQLPGIRDVSDIKDVIRALNMDLRREPSYSRVIFDHLISQYTHKMTGMREVISFLDDPSINIATAGNYLAAVDHFVSRKGLTKRHFIFDTILRALRIGTIPSEEIDAILIRLSEAKRYKQDRMPLTNLYRLMWDAIGECKIYGHRDLNEAVLDTWLGLLLQSDTTHDLSFVRDIMLVSGKSSWAQKIILEWLEAPIDIDTSRQLCAEEIAQFLKPFDADMASRVVIGVTESLINSEKLQLLERWRECLAMLHNSAAIASTPIWNHIPVVHTSNSHRAPMSPQHQIVQRLWALYSMNLPLFEGERPNKRCHPTIYKLYGLYDTGRGNKGDLWTSLTDTIHDLKIPWPDWLGMMRDLGTSQPRVYHNLAKFNDTTLNFPKIFADVHAYDAAAPFWYSNIEKWVYRVNIATPAFRNHAVHVARTGDSASVWTLFRLFRSHTPLKISLSRAYPGLETSPRAQKKWHGKPRDHRHPDPFTSLRLIHDVANAVACSTQFSSRQAFELVRWLYVFLLKHDAPIDPVIARALYHAGVIRNRRAGNRVSILQYRYIWEIVQMVERPEIVESLKHRTSHEGDKFLHDETEQWEDF
ncbi:hypothetical protein BJX99DRAFT_250075 [Aspergillus californicus]